MKFETKSLKTKIVNTYVSQQVFHTATGQKNQKQPRVENMFPDAFHCARSKPRRAAEWKLGYAEDSSGGRSKNTGHATCGVHLNT